MELKSLSPFRKIQNNLFIIIIGVLLLLFTLANISVVVLLGLYSLYIFKKDKKIFLCFFILIIIITICYLLRLMIFKEVQESNLTGVVISIKRTETYNKIIYNKIILKNKIYKYIIYDYDLNNIRIGQVINVEGKPLEISKAYIWGMFDYSKYYKSQNIVGICQQYKINIKDTSFNMYFIRRYIYEYIMNNNLFSNNTKSYLLGFVIGDNSLIDDDILSSYKLNGITHLFSISGLHCNLLTSFISFVLTKLNINKKKINKLIISILVIYSYITNMMISIIRTTLCYILKYYNDLKKLNLSNLDILLIVFLLVIVFNPMYIYNQGFILSFLASFSVLLVSTVLKNLKPNYKLFVITLFIQLSTLVVLINMNYQINLLSIFTNVLFIPITSFFIIPLCFITLFIPYLDIVTSNVLKIYEALSIFIKNRSIVISMPKLNTYEILIYYSLLFFVLLQNKIVIKHLKKFIFISFMFIFIYYNKINLNIYGKIEFLSCLEGDSTVIDLPFNKGVVVIDCGVSKDRDVINYLKSKGVRKIDYLVLTHNHSDHSGNMQNLIDNFNVKTIVTNEYFTNTYNIKNNDKIYHLKLKNNESFRLKDVTFNVLNPNSYHNNENDNSLVLSFKLGSLNYLLLGDVSKTIEESLNISNIDVVKVAHHGSNTSTSKMFYQRINPKVCIIETGRKKTYNFPSQEVLNTLSDYKVYRTDLDSSIRIKYLKKRSIISKLR